MKPPLNCVEACLKLDRRGSLVDAIGGIGNGRLILQGDPRPVLQGDNHGRDRAAVDDDKQLLAGIAQRRARTGSAKPTRWGVTVGAAVQKADDARAYGQGR